MSFAARQQTTSGSSTILACGDTSSPYINAYGFGLGTGFLSKFSNPSTALPLAPESLAFSPSGRSLAAAHGNSPYVTVYAMTNNGFGAKYSNPAVLPGSGANSAYGVTFSPTGADIAVTSNASPFIYVYPWSDSTGFGTKYADPATLPIFYATSVAFSPNNANVAVSTTQSPYQAVYPWTSGTGFGAKYSDPSTALPGNCSSVSFSYDTSAIAFGSNTSPYVIAYNFTSGTGFGSKFANPSTLPAGSVTAVQFSTAPLSSIIYVFNATPYLDLYSWSLPTGFGSSYGAPTSLSSQSFIFVYDVAVSKQYKNYFADVAVVSTGSPNLVVYPFGGSPSYVWGTQYANPSTLPAGAPNCVAWGTLS